MMPCEIAAISKDDQVKRALMERVSVPVEIAGKAFGLGRNASYAAVKNQELPSIRDRQQDRRTDRAVA